jgi:hypothetical protein
VDSRRSERREPLKGNGAREREEEPRKGDVYQLRNDRISQKRGVRDRPIWHSLAALRLQQQYSKHQSIRASKASSTQVLVVVGCDSIVTVIVEGLAQSHGIQGQLSPLSLSIN